MPSCVSVSLFPRCCGAGDEGVVLADDGCSAERVRGGCSGDVGRFSCGGGTALGGGEAVAEEAEDGFDVGGLFPVFAFFLLRVGGGFFFDAPEGGVSGVGGWCWGRYVCVLEGRVKVEGSC